MQRFACPLERLERYLAGGNVFDVFTHAMSLETVLSFHDAAGDRAKKRGAFIHAAASSLLHEPAAWMDGVRPGVALYEGAVRVTSRLISVQRTYGGVGYSGAQAPYVGLILAGYAHGLRHGPVSINGRRQQLIEVAMNSSFTTVDPRDQADDEVVLLGEELNERALAAHFASRPHEILCRYCSMGVRDYVEDDSAAALFGRGGALRVSAGAAQ
jgi:alanine racemase